MSKFLFYFHGQRVNVRDICSEIHEYMIQAGFLSTESDDMYIFRHCGYIQHKNTTVFCLPYGAHHKLALTSKDEIDYLNFGRRVVQAIIRYNQQKDSRVDIEFMSFGNLHESLELLNDYFNFGLLKKRLKIESKKTNGKINWKKTIQNSRPLINSSQIIYNDFYTDLNYNDFNTMLTHVHKRGIKLATECASVIYPEYQKTTNNLEKSKLEDLEILSFIDNNRHLINDDRSKRIIDITYKLISSNFELYSHATSCKNFEYIWEKMLQDTFEHDFSMMRILPKIHWQDCLETVEKYKVKTQKIFSRPIPDIVTRNEQSELFIFDAKYYDLINKPYRPSLLDLWKQHAYRTFFEHEYGKKYKYINALLFPIYTKDSFTTKYLTTASFFSESTAENALPNIDGYFVNISLVIDRYLSNNHLKNEMIKEILSGK